MKSVSSSRRLHWRKYHQEKNAGKYRAMPREQVAFLDFATWVQFCDDIAMDAAPGPKQALVDAIYEYCLSKAVENFLLNVGLFMLFERPRLLPCV